MFAAGTLLGLLVTQDFVLELILFFPAVYGFCYLFAFLFSLKAGNSRQNRETQIAFNEEQIAILMTVCNDFEEKAALSAVNQEYEKYHVFILDDSTIGSEREMVNKWCGQYPSKCTKLSRKDNRGFKAGNLNDAEKKIPSRYELFCIVDSDQVLPPTFLQEIHRTYAINEKPAFVQGIHKGIHRDVSRFSKSLSAIIYPEWRYHLSYKNKYGLPTVLGHGYLIRREYLIKVGGHPEIVSEDLALTMLLSTHGYSGVMAPEIVSLEVYPQSFKSIQSRRFRWTMADWEILFTRYFKIYIKSPLPLLTEKIDLILREIRLPLSTIYFAISLIFMLIISINKAPDHISGNAADGKSFLTGFIFLISISPLYPLIFSTDSQFSFRVKAFFGSFFIALSMIGIQLSAGISYLIKRKAYFYVTNDKTKKGPHGRKSLVGPKSSLSLALDIIASVILFVYSFNTGDLFVSALGVCQLARTVISIAKFRNLETQISSLGFLLFTILLVQILFNGGLSIVGIFLFCSLPFLLV